LLIKSLDNSQLHKGPITRTLLERIAEGEEASFAVLYRFYYRELQPIGWRCIESGIEPAEVMQLTFMKLWVNRERLVHIENLRAWVFTIAYREYLMAVRKKISYEEKLGQMATDGAVSNGPVTPFQVVNYHALQQCIQDILEGLSPQRKMIYALSRHEGLKIDEIAARLSISPNTVKSVLQTVLKVIKEKLTQAGYGPLTLIIFLQFLNT
jgi:RNA polymerase sigma-70 factor (ECF subfamily)